MLYRIGFRLFLFCIAFLYCSYAIEFGNQVQDSRAQKDEYINKVTQTLEFDFVKKTKDADSKDSIKTNDSTSIINHSQNIESAKQNYFITVGDADFLSAFAKDTVNNISNELFKKSGFKLFVYAIKDLSNEEESISKDLSSKFYARKNYEESIISSIDGDYAIVFLYYNDRKIALRSNIDFLKEDDLLDTYAYPYMPLANIGSSQYDDGVNDGMSNLYLGLVKELSNHYGIKMNIPDPKQKPDEMTKVVLYAMLAVLIGLFIMVSSGVFRKKSVDRGDKNATK